ncbi:MAG: lytic murein transglycosylase [Minisyncoccia bacterium]
MKRITQIIALFSFCLIIMGGYSARADNSSSTSSSTATSTPSAAQKAQEERAALEQQLSDLEKQIEQNQATITEYQKQGKTLSSQISTLNAQVNKLNLQIKAVNLEITQLDGEIKSTQGQINQTEDQITTHKDAISKSLRLIYESDRETLTAILLSNNNLSDFFGSLNDIALVQGGLRTSLEEITKLRQQLLDQKQELSSEKTDTENFKAIQQAQQKALKNTQSQKTTLLKETKGKESEYQKILTKDKATAAQIRSRIFELLGGGELTFAKAYDYAKLAEGATGVRSAIILAILNRESLLGKNVGRCSYKTAMNPTRDKPIFLNLLSKLGIDPDSQSVYVSCANQHGSYGGAMGPAQFIPSTWKLYSDAISKVTGNTPANPWNNSDAFAATGLYIKDLEQSATCVNYATANKSASLPYQTLIERCAAAKYYAGASWYTYRFWYGQPVVDQADKFQDDIDTLNGK